jgi:putative heme-binding domain-containing protein
VLQFCLCVALFVGAAAGARAQPKADFSDDVEAERKLLVVPEGFEVQLVASEPTVINPVQIQFDPQGRLWALCLPRYPQLLPGQDPRDYIVVLEDFGPDGKARKSHVFADGLMIPTGIAPGGGGCYVGQAERLWHFKDTKGTGRADQRRMLLTGFGVQDTHHTLNSFRWGPGGFLYFNQGIYIKSNVETPYGPRKLWGGAVWQLRPESLKLEVYDRSILGTNTWGHVFDRWGQSFCTTAWPDGIHLILPDSPLNHSNDADVVPPLKLTRVGDGRHCGSALITGRHVPDDWQGNLVSGAFHSQQVQRWGVTDDGTRYVMKPLPPLVVSKHRKFRPVDMQMGPDGALYVADWYDEVIQHNQIDFRDPRRDHSRGRIWRIVRKDRKLLPTPPLVNVALNTVLDQLEAPEQWTREQAKRALAERDPKEVAAALETWVKALDAKDAHALLEALWTYQTIDHVEPSLLARVLRSDEPRARAAATRVLGYWHDRVPDATRLLAVQAADPSPRVRLEAVLAASRIPSAQALEAALVALDQPADRLVDFALRKTAVVLKPYWYPEFQKGKLTFAGRPRALSFALQAVKATDSLPKLAGLVQSGQVPADRLADVLGLLAVLGDAPQQALAWDAARADGRLRSPERVHVLEALEQAARARKAKPAAAPEHLAELVRSKDAPLAAAAARLAGAWKVETLRGDLDTLAASADPRVGTAAVAALVDLGGPETARRLEALAGAKEPYPVRQRATVGLVSLDPKRAAAAASGLLAQPTSATNDPGDLYVAFLQRTGGAAALTNVLKTTKPSQDAAKIGLRTLTTLGTPAGPLQQLLQDASGLTDQKRDTRPKAIRRLLALVQTQGDARRGEDVFRRASLGCLQCHAVAGAGGRVGPELTGIGASSQVDYLLESILLPSKVVREGYNTAHVFTADGKAHSGVIVRESPKELVLRNATHDELVVPTGDIEQRRNGGSLMPDGLDRQLTDAELADLVKFLTELGRPGPFAVGHVPAARRWQVLAGPDAATFGTAPRDDVRLPWAVAFSKVSGDLPLAEFTPRGPLVLRCQLDATMPGRVAVRVNDARGLAMWVDGRPAEPAALDLPRGVPTLDFRVDPATVPTFRCELAEGQARFVGGK